MASKNPFAHAGLSDSTATGHSHLHSIRTKDALFDWVRSFAGQPPAATQVSAGASVLALSRTSFALASELASEVPQLDCRVLLARSFASPQNADIELGAVIEDGEIYLSRGASHLGLREIDVETAALESIRELQDLRRENPQLPRFVSSEAPVLIVDDGSTALVTLLAAVRFLKNQGLSDITLALPQTLGDYGRRLDQVDAKLLLFDNDLFDSVSVSNAKAVQIPCGRSAIKGEMEIVEELQNGIIICVHGTGPGPGNVCGNGIGDGRLKRAAREFFMAGFSVFTFDLLDDTEIGNANDEFMTALLAHRLSLIVEWISTQKNLRKQPIGLFGIGFASSAALQVAAQYPLKISAVVAHTMRPKISTDYLRLVRAPTLFLSEAATGGTMGDLALKAEICFSELNCEKRKVEIDEVDDVLATGAAHASLWFRDHAAEKADKQRPPNLRLEASYQTN